MLAYTPNVYMSVEIVGKSPRCKAWCELCHHCHVPSNTCLHLLNEHVPRYTSCTTEWPLQVLFFFFLPAF